jgi:hypothetical protein
MYQSNIKQITCFLIQISKQNDLPRLNYLRHEYNEDSYIALSNTASEANSRFLQNTKQLNNGYYTNQKQRENIEIKGYTTRDTGDAEKDTGLKLSSRGRIHR